MGEVNKNSSTTPMIRQYLEIKEQYADFILFYRMGDFYEMFFSDAETASAELEITLTSRNKNEAVPVPMCGVPVKAAESYIGRLIDRGYKVAVCEQVEDPSTAKGLVRREVMRVVTPGMVVNNELLDAKSNNYILSVCRNNGTWGISCLDLSTGTFRVSQAADARLIRDETARISPSELLIPESAEKDPEYEQITGVFSEKQVTCAPDEIFEYQPARARLLEKFHTRSLEGFGCEELKCGTMAAGALFFHVQDTQKQELSHICGMEAYHLDRHLLIDDVSCRNLELLENIRNGSRQGTLLGVMDLTVTAMGGRMLKRWLRYPLLDIAEISARLDAVSAAAARPGDRRDARDALKAVADLERLGGKIAMGQGNARDLCALKRSIEALPAILSATGGMDADLFAADETLFVPLYELADEIGSSIVDDPPPTINEGGMIRQGYDARLDELIHIARDGRSYLAELEAQERGKTGINSLKVRYNKVFGYYIEVSKVHSESVPDHYVRKQTLVNAERYITDELKTFETRVLGAQEQQALLEHEIFLAIRDLVVAKNPEIQTAASFIARADVLSAFGELAEKNGYVRPAINSEGVIQIEDGRHPVVEKLVTGERFVPNSLHMDNSENQILIITGPNMAGKSTVLRQAALIVLMAQTGSFVPAGRADLCIIDRIFTRVGALDNLSQGQSTFMVEMEETANIINNAGPDSLVIMDEIGRGTSTYDGLSIAWAVAEHLHDLRGAGVKSLFATHYHQLTELPAGKPRVKNFNIAVQEWNDEIIFLHRLVEGGTNRSYGIQVARLAGMPESLIRRANTVLAEIEEKGRISSKGNSGREPDKKKEAFRQLSLFRRPDEIVIDELMKIDISAMTPLEAINFLSRLKETVLKSEMP